jgi:hypothetical protein
LELKNVLAFQKGRKEVSGNWRREGNALMGLPSKPVKQTEQGQCETDVRKSWPLTDRMSSPTMLTVLRKPLSKGFLA